MEPGAIVQSPDMAYYVAAALLAGILGLFWVVKPKATP
jgi:hypothetical protein